MSVASEAAGHPPIGVPSSLVKRQQRAFYSGLIFCVFASAAVLLTLVVDVASDGGQKVSGDLITNFPSTQPERAGLQPALMGTLWLMGVCAAFIVPVGVATAVYLEEYADRRRWYNRAIEVNIQNLAAVPSIVYGILGLAYLVRGPLELGRVVLAGGLTLGLLVLPVVIVAGREAIRAVPPSIREGCMALGATKWQTIWKQVLPASIPGVATGVILALSRAIGETAPLIVVGAAAFITYNPSGLTGDTAQFDAVPIQIFEWLSRPQADFQLLAAAAILILIAVLMVMNSFAIYLRNRYEQKW